MKNEILRLERVTTIQDEVTLLDNFNLHIFQGEIMGLVCINANGKESLIQLISQNLPIHYGRVYFNEVLVNNYQHSPLTMNKVAVIEQKSRLIEDLSVTDNVFVLRRGFKKYLINPRVLNEQLKQFVKEIDPNIDGNDLVANLSPYEKCVVELLRAVIMGAKLIVIMDISNCVSAADLVKFHNLLRHYCQKGFSFLYICNHHEEAFKICTRMSLMKDGKILKVFDQHEFKNENLVPYYIGEFADVKKVTVNRRSEKGILTFQNVCTENLNHMTFSVSKGECTVLFDMDNIILSDIMQLMNGKLRQDSGSIFLENAVYSQNQARHALGSGVAFIGEDPIRSMLFKEMSYIDNLCFLLDKKENGVRLSKRIIKSIIREYEPLIGPEIYESNIMNLKIQSLYDLIYYRIQLFHPKIVFCVQPFAGADMYLRRHLIELINKLKKKGITVIFLAVNIADSLVVADKLILLEKGRFSSEYLRSEFNAFSSEGIIL
nr:ATP-binding cassette domain-containing protein [uncultured Caproiciproducens sp.]